MAHSTLSESTATNSFNTSKSPEIRELRLEPQSMPLIQDRLIHPSSWMAAAAMSMQSQATGIQELEMKLFLVFTTSNPDEPSPMDRTF
jgi:hypothetical protein